jgi:hypothetical protein
MWVGAYREQLNGQQLEVEQVAVAYFLICLLVFEVRGLMFEVEF